MSEVFADRFRQCRRAAGLTQAELALRLGVQISTISSYERGAAYPRAELLIAVASILHVSLDYLLALSDVSTDFVPSSRGHVHGGPDLALNQGSNGLHIGPLPHLVVSARAQAGVMSPYFEDEWREECEAVRLPGIEGPAFLLEIVGDSMEPLFYEGDKAVVVPMEDERELTMNRLVAVVTAGSGVYIKTLRAHRMDGGIRLASLNTAYDDIVIAGGEYFKIYLVQARYSYRLNLDGMPQRSAELEEMRDLMARLRSKFPDL